MNREKIKDEVWEEVIRPYHKNTEVTKMRVKDAIDLAISKTIEWKDKEIEEMKEVVRVQNNIVHNVAKAIFEDIEKGGFLSVMTTDNDKQYQELRKKWLGEK